MGCVKDLILDAESGVAPIWFRMELKEKEWVKSSALNESKIAELQSQGKKPKQSW